MFLSLIARIRIIHTIYLNTLDAMPTTLDHIATMRWQRHIDIHLKLNAITNQSIKRRKEMTNATQVIHSTQTLMRLQRGTKE